MHPIKRAGLIALFSFGAIAGFGHGFASLGQCHQHRRDAFEGHVADVCTRSAERSFAEHDRDRDRERDHDRDRQDARFIPYGAPQWGPPQYAQPQYAPPQYAQPQYAPQYAAPQLAQPQVVTPAPVAAPVVVDAPTE
jgi:hypothetical protein